jgi:DNA-binding response OmpR family regulator
MSTPFAFVVEDDADVAAIFQVALTDAGYTTEVFNNGHEAQAQLVFTTPDLILLDIHLPSLAGGVLLRQLGGQKRLANVAVVIVSGDADEVKRYQNEGYQSLLKPVGYEILREVAEELIASTV